MDCAHYECSHIGHPVADLLASESIAFFWSVKREGGMRDVPDVHFIQRCCHRSCNNATDCESDVFQLECFRVGAAGSIIVSGRVIGQQNYETDLLRVLAVQLLGFSGFFCCLC